MDIAQLHYISQAPATGSHLDAITDVLKAGCKWIQLRVKDEPEDIVLQLAVQANSLCERYGANLIVNDYPYTALGSAAFGVHLGLDDMPVPAARIILGRDRCIGGTANTFDDIMRRVEEGADYIGLGPFRFTTTKKNLSPVLGIEGYHRLMQQVSQAGITIPVIAIGGITIADIAAILQTGVHGIAVSGLLTNDGDLPSQLLSIKQEIDLHAKKKDYANDCRQSI
jgi:thiamine-phosphate pyrophosphorylase